MNRKLILYIAMSLDGYIADSNESLDFLSMVEEEGEDYGYFDFVNSVDTVIIGRKTYSKVIEMGYDYPHTDKAVYIITRTKQDDIGSFKFYTENLTDLVTDLKKQEGKDIYCDGGAEIVNQLLKNNLIDEYRISIIPILLGNGIKLFKGKFSEQKLSLLSSKQFKKGLVQVHYKNEKNYC